MPLYYQIAELFNTNSLIYDEVNNVDNHDDENKV